MQIRQLTVPNKTLFTLTQTFRYLNCCCNFFLYSATSSLFRRELREIFQCSNSSITSHTDINTDFKQRSRTLSSPPLHSTCTDNNHSPECQNLLSTTTLTTQLPSTKTTVENFSITDSTNGHTVSFKI
jgi:hypothetical protein